MSSFNRGQVQAATTAATGLACFIFRFLRRPQNGNWKQAINNLAIKPMQQFAYTSGKNATDGFMIIDAMDLLYTDRIDGFAMYQVIVTLQP